MAAITLAVVGTAIAIKGQRDTKKAQKKAAKKVSEASIQSAEQLREATRAGEIDILEAQRQAAQRVALGSVEAQARIQPFAAPGALAFQRGKQQVLAGGRIGGGIGEAVRRASLSGIDPRVFETAGLGGELARQARISESGITPAFNQELLAAGRGGIAAAGDIGGIRGRGFERLADIVGATGAQRASLLVGSGPQLQQLSQGANEARLLSDVASQRARTSQIQTLAGLAGQIF